MGKGKSGNGEVAGLNGTVYERQDGIAIRCCLSDESMRMFVHFFDKIEIVRKIGPIFRYTFHYIDGLERKSMSADSGEYVYLEDCDVRKVFVGRLDKVAEYTGQGRSLEHQDVIRDIPPRIIPEVDGKRVVSAVRFLPECESSIFNLLMKHGVGFEYVKGEDGAFDGSCIRVMFRLRDKREDRMWYEELKPGHWLAVDVDGGIHVL